MNYGSNANFTSIEKLNEENRSRAGVLRPIKSLWWRTPVNWKVRQLHLRHLALSHTHRFNFNLIRWQNPTGSLKPASTSSDQYISLAFVMSPRHPVLSVLGEDRRQFLRERDARAQGPSAASIARSHWLTLFTKDRISLYGVPDS